MPLRLRCINQVIGQQRSVNNTESLMEEWPAYTFAAQEAMDAIAYTHQAIPIAAYDLYGDNIPPHAYEEYFKGALAQICFTLTHHLDEVGDVFWANIDSIHILCKV